MREFAFPVLPDWAVEVLLQSRVKGGVAGAIARGLALKKSHRVIFVEDSVESLVFSSMTRTVATFK